MNALAPITLKATLEPLTPILSAVQEESDVGLSLREKKAFQDFETMFVLMMLKEMRKTMNGSSMTEKSHATKMYEEMMDEAMAEQMAASNQLGIAKDLSNKLQADRLRQKLQLVEAAITLESFAEIKV